jgi:hypothetical protein
VGGFCKKESRELTTSGRSVTRWSFVQEFLFDKAPEMNLLLVAGGMQSVCVFVASPLWRSLAPRPPKAEHKDHRRWEHAKFFIGFVAQVRWRAVANWLRPHFAKGGEQIAEAPRMLSMFHGNSW